jgi:hypothetical protein
MRKQVGSFILDLGRRAVALRPRFRVSQLLSRRGAPCYPPLFSVVSPGPGAKRITALRDTAG